MRGPNQSLIPFTIKSTVSFDALCILIGEKLNSLPGLLQLVYRFDSDKQKTPSTSIRTEQELEMFMSRMRALIVPPALKNGTKSNRVPKAVTVYFEDTAQAPANGASTASGKNTATKQVCPFLPPFTLN